MEKVCFYNVENLFPADPAKSHRTDPSPSGLRGWNPWRYGQKLKAISRVLDYLQQEGRPLFIGLSEVASDDVLSDLLTQAQLERIYGFVHYDSLDERGVDVALLYNKEKFELQFSESISIVFDESMPELEDYDTTRDVLYVQGRVQGHPVHIFVLHLPSKRLKDVNAPKRKIVLKRLSDYIEEHIPQQQALVVMGDFNENPNEPQTERFAERNRLHNPFKSLHLEGKASTFHRSQGLLYDQILVRNLFCKSPRVEQPVFLRQKEMAYRHLPARTYVGSRYLGGYSDHFPVSLMLEF